MIEAIELTSTRRARHAVCGPVENVSFDVYPGQVTALLGAPGTGKSTVLRLMVELEPGGGRTLFGGRPYRALKPAVREVGLSLNPDAVHPGRTVQAHLQLYAVAGGVPKPRVAEVLEVAGLSTQATVRCGRLDAGQRQRLSIAAALIGDPAALILDEPHALDSHGMSWFHALIRAYAAQGRTVLVAATDPDTLSGTADHVVVLRRDERDGISRVIASRSAAEVFDERRATVVQVRSPQAARLAAALEAEGASLASAGPGALQVRGLDRARIGEVAHGAGVCLHELSEIGHDDDVFGLRPVPRQKELLPGLNRTGAIWHSGVRLVTDEIEEAEVVEAAVEAGAEEDAGAGAEAEEPATVTVVTVGAQAAATVQGEAEADGQVPAQPDAKPSAVGSWRTQGSVAGTRWSAVKGSQQQGPATRSSTATSASDTAEEATSTPDSPVPTTPATSADQPVTTAAPTSSATPGSATPSPTPVKPRDVHRRTAFGLHWGRGRPQHPAPKPSEPAAVAASVLVQPAVPFTVALPAPEQDAAADGMTPWRAAAARTSQHGQQSASVAEAAPAEQETSA